MMENEKREKKKNEIVDSAFALFMKKGYENAKIVEIAESAGIGKGTVYEYFKSKDEILLEIIDKYIKTEYDRLPALLGDADTFEEKLRVFIKFESDFIEKYGRFAFEVRDIVVDAHDVQMSSDIIRAIYRIVETEYSFAQEMVQNAISAGELRSVNKSAAAYLAVGIISTYAAMKGGILERGCAVRLPDESPICLPLVDLKHDIDTGEFTEDDVISMIMRGIGA